MAWLDNTGYMRIKEKGTRKNRLEHRVIWEQAYGKIPKDMCIHHINSIKTDNRLENLRLVTNQENHQMSDIWGKGYGIKSSQIRPYYAYRAIHGKKIHLGMFGTPCGATMASRMFYVNG